MILTKKITHRLDSTQGEFAGQKMFLLPWQERFIKGVFLLEVNTAALSIGPRAGKTAFIAAIEIVILVNRKITKSSEITMVGAVEKQSTVLFWHIIQFLGDNPDVRMSDGNNSPAVVNSKTDLCVGGKATNSAGLNGPVPYLILLDKVSQFRRIILQEVMEILPNGVGKITDARMVVLGTRSDQCTDEFRQLIKTSDYSLIYASGEVDLVFHKKMWVKVDPALWSTAKKRFDDLWKAYQNNTKRAKDPPRALRLNQPADIFSADTLCAADEWHVVELADSVKPGTTLRQYMSGSDLNFGESMSTVADPKKADCFAVFRAIPDLIKQGKCDGIGSMCSVMQKRGELITIQGRVPVSGTLLTVELEWSGKSHTVVCDQWRVGEKEDALDAMETRAPIQQYGQRYKDSGEDIRDFTTGLPELKVPVSGLSWPMVTEPRLISPYITYGL